jgi:hypothetical protein
VSYVYTNLLFLAAIVVPPLLVTLAVFVDLRSGRGFGLVLLVLAMMAVCLWRIVPTELGLLHAPASKPTLFQIALFFAFLLCGYLTLLVWIGTVVEVSMARQMRWLIALVVEAVLAVAVVLAVLLLQLETPLFTFLGGAEASLVLLLPMVTALAYGVVRSAKPTPRPEPAPGERIPAAASDSLQPSSRLRPQPEAQSRGPVLAVRILSVIMLLSVSCVIVLAGVGLIRTPWHTYPAGTSEDVIGTGHLVMMVFSMFCGVPAAVVAIVVGHVTLVMRRRIPQRAAGTSPRRVALRVLLVAGLVTAYLAVAMQLYYWVLFYRTNGYG